MVVRVSMGILLKDVLQFDELKKKYPKKRIKLRFNTSWKDSNSEGKLIERNYLEMYCKLENREFFKNSILSLGSGKKSRMSKKDLVFQFIEVEPHIWLLVDAVDVKEADGSLLKFDEFRNSYFPVAKVETLTQYQPFFNRLTVNWKNLPQQFYYVKNEIINSVEINEILPKEYLNLENDFVGYENVSKSYVELSNLIMKNSWKNALSDVFGVYVLTDSYTGKLYIGSATGENGIYGRWKTYLEKGYDKSEEEDKKYPNKQLRDLVEKKGIGYIKNNFIYTIVEIFPKNEMGKTKALQREIYWKEALKTRENGYNSN